MKKIASILLFSGTFVTGLVTAQETAAPQPVIPNAPDAVPGQCHALVNVPAQLADRVEEITVQDAGESLEVIPAKYEWIEKKVPISEEEKTVEIIPATYKTVEEQIIVEPERKEYEVIPAKYEDVEEKVMIKPAMRVWKKSSGGAASLSGEVMRLIQVPAKYDTVIKKKMITPPQIREVIIPAKYATIEKKIIDKPSTTREVIIPAEYKTIRIKQLIGDPQEVRKPTKPVVKKITRQEVVRDAQLSWQRVPCDKDINENNITTLQKGLRRLGYNVSVDGKFGKGTREALEKFQESKGLAKGAVTIETMKALGVDIK
ncbi:MAG: hypothetical protein CSA45_01160 [Gammaproteobacteria bacterium]|nr:MAG: hypothetical protein CSA45_01160 [Gammaproteobacteria bacterium]